MLSRAGMSVILDAKYDRLLFREAAIALANESQIPLQIIHCTAPTEVLLSRLENRIGDIADATPSLLTSQIQQAEPFTEKEKPFVKIVDTTQPQDAQLKDVLRS